MKSFQGIIHTGTGTIKNFHWYWLDERYNSRLVGYPSSFVRIFGDLSIFGRSFTATNRRTLRTINVPADISYITGRVLVVKMYMHDNKRFYILSRTE